MSVSINRWLAALAALALVLGTVGRTSGEIIIDRNTTIDYSVPYDEEIHVVEGSNPDPPTVVDFVEPAYARNVRAFDGSVVNMTGGDVLEIEARDSSTANYSGGTVGSMIARDHGTLNYTTGDWLSGLEAHDFSTATLLGGCNNVDGYDSSEVTILAGSGYSEVVQTFQSATMHVYGGDIEYIHVHDASLLNHFGGSNGLLATHHSSAASVSGGALSTLWAEDSSTVEVSGGSIRTIRAGQEYGMHASVITVRGTAFNYPYGEIPDPDGTLTGTLANGDPIDAPFWIHSNASIVLVPEPSTLLLLSMSAASLAFYVWRRRRHGKAAAELP